MISNHPQFSVTKKTFLTMSKRIYCPMDFATKQDKTARSVKEYRRPESTMTLRSGRSGLCTAEARETDRSMLQIRYASSIVESKLVDNVVA